MSTELLFLFSSSKYLWRQYHGVLLQMYGWTCLCTILPQIFSNISERFCLEKLALQIITFQPLKRRYNIWGLSVAHLSISFAQKQWRNRSCIDCTWIQIRSWLRGEMQYCVWPAWRPRRNWDLKQLETTLDTSKRIVFLKKLVAVR